MAIGMKEQSQSQVQTPQTGEQYLFLDPTDKKLKRKDSTGTVTNIENPGGPGGGVTDHGALTGLGDDDHSQYHNDARGDARYYLKNEVDTKIADLVNSAPETLNTLDELANALGDDPNFATSTATALGNRLRVDTASQNLSSIQKTNAKTNLDLNNVNNTSDSNKPISTATQNALNTKQTIHNTVFNIELEDVYVDDFTARVPPFSIFANAGTSQNYNTQGPPSQNAQGCHTLILISATAGNRIAALSNAQFFLGRTFLRSGMRIICESSDASNRHRLEHGFLGTQVFGDQPDGLYFKWTDNENGGRYQAIAASGGVRTVIDTGYTPVSNAFLSTSEYDVFEIEINQAGTQALFYINGNLVATHTTGLPSLSTSLFWGYKFDRVAAIPNQKNMSVDWVYLVTRRSTARK